MQRLIVRPARLPLIARVLLGGTLIVVGFPVGTIPWSEIRGAKLRRVSRAQVLLLDLRHPEGLVGRLPAPQRYLGRLSLALGRSPVRLAMSGTDSAPDAVLAFVREQVSRRAAAQRAGPW